MARRDNEYPTILAIMGDFLMSAKKTEELQEFLKTQPNFLIKEDEERQMAELLKAAEERGSWNENPEEDGYWISPDGSIIEIFYNVDYDDPVHADWIRHARKTQGANDNQAN